MITGATSGIGKALTMTYLNQGERVIACGRDAEKLEQLTQESPNVCPLCFDLTDYLSYPTLDEQLDLIILNAGDCIYIDNPVEFDAQAFERLIQINLISVGYSLQKWLPNLKPGGRLVLVSSSAALLPLPRAEAYGTSKAALSYLAKTLALTLPRHGIRVSLVQPGFVDTPLTKRNTFAMPMLLSSQRAAQKIVAGIAQGQAEINVPFGFVLMMKLIRMLPDFIWRKLAQRMV